MHVCKGLSWIIYLYCFLFTCYHDVIDISEDISAHLIFEDGLYHSIKSGAGIVEAFEHSEIAVGAKRCNKGCFFFIFLAEPNLMIVGEVVGDWVLDLTYEVSIPFTETMTTFA
jgi:hypothetical protein